jgi:hypothetical protein
VASLDPSGSRGNAVKNLKWILVSIALILVILLPGLPAWGTTFMTAPSPITSVTLVSSGDTWAYLEWNECTGADAYSVRYSDSAYPSSNTTGTQGYWGTETSCNITGLTPDQGYFFTIFPIAIEGAYSSYNSVTTAAKISKGTNGWEGISQIYYDLAQEDAYDTFLEEAADELKLHLDEALSTTFTIVNEMPEAPAIYLSVNATALSEYNDEGNHILTDFDGVHITGKTPIAVREGAYLFLEELGFRWLSRSDDWTIIPSNPSLVTIDEYNEPGYVWRRLMHPVTEDEANFTTWLKRNLSGGAKSWFVTHSYGDFMDGDDYAAYPDAFLPEGVDPEDGLDFQLKPDNADVIDIATAYALEYLSGNHSTYIDTIPRMVVPVSPNDGLNWGTYFDEDSYTEDDIQNLSAKVFGLCDNVSANISGTYPNAYVGAFCYSGYSGYPVSISNNVYIEVTTWYDYAYTDKIRIENAVSAGAKAGFYDYNDVNRGYVPPYWANTILDRIQSYNDYGAEVYTLEGGDSWGAYGIVYWLASKLAWNPDADLDTLKQDYYTKAFGDAASYMEDYYERWFDQMSPNDNTFALSFRSLDDALNATDVEAEKDRIRQIIAYMLWYKEYVDLASLNAEDSANLYLLTNKLHDWYTTYWTYTAPSTRNQFFATIGADTYVSGNWTFSYVSNEVTGVNGDALSKVEAGDYIKYLTSYRKVQSVANDNLIYLTQVVYSNTTASENATTVCYGENVEPYENDTPPTDEEIDGWLADAITEFSGEVGYDAPYINPLDIILASLEDGVTANITNTTVHRNNCILVQANEGDNITLSTRSWDGADADTISIYDSSDIETVIDTIETPASSVWTSQNWTAPATTTGLFIFEGMCGLDVLNKPASFCDLPGTNDIDYAMEYAYSGYIYVPEGTESLLVECIDTGNASYLYAPDDYVNPEVTIAADSYGGVNSPAVGLWKYTFGAGASASGFKIFGVPAMIWHRPYYLLVEDN